MPLREFLSEPAIAARFAKVRPFFRLRESAYDVTSVCQLRCDGCYYFSREQHRVTDRAAPDAWRDLMTAERDRGINFVNLAGAEPALVPDILRACFSIQPSGCVFTNGLRTIPSDIRYRLHLSVWGDERDDREYRRLLSGKRGPAIMDTQLKNYRHDDRVVFVYTFNELNVAQADNVVRRLVDAGHRVTFNVFSQPFGAGSGLQIATSLGRIHDKMLALMEQFGGAILYSKYSAHVHTQTQSLRDQFGCPYPRAWDGVTPRHGVAQTFRSYRADHSHTVATDCCIPDTRCEDCRHYAAGSAIVTAALLPHSESRARLCGWLDYVDTYLATWILGYVRDSAALLSEGLEVD